MINKNVFIFNCKKRGLDKEAAENLYKIAAANQEVTKKTIDENTMKPQDVKTEQKPETKSEEIKKAAFDMGFNDALKLAYMLKNKK